MDINTPWLNSLLDSWLNEDLGRGDLSAKALTEGPKSAHWIAKEGGIFCGGILVVLRGFRWFWWVFVGFGFGFGLMRVAFFLALQRRAKRRTY